TWDSPRGSLRSEVSQTTRTLPNDGGSVQFRAPVVLFREVYMAVKIKPRRSSGLVTNETSPSVSPLLHITFNLKKTPVRFEMLEGRQHLVVPMVMLTEGVHCGSQGCLFYPEEELAKVPAVWNYKPIVVYHP